MLLHIHLRSLFYYDAPKAIEKYEVSVSFCKFPSQMFSFPYYREGEVVKSASVSFKPQLHFGVLFIGRELYHLPAYLFS